MQKTNITIDTVRTRDGDLIQIGEFVHTSEVLTISMTNDWEYRAI